MMEKNVRKALWISGGIIAAMLLCMAIVFLGLMRHFFGKVMELLEGDELPKEAVCALVEENHALLTRAAGEVRLLMAGLDYGYISVPEKEPLPKDAGRIKGLYRFDSTYGHRSLDSEPLKQALALEGLLSISYQAGREPQDKFVIDFYCGGPLRRAAESRCE